MIGVCQVSGGKIKIDPSVYIKNSIIASVFQLISYFTATISLNLLNPVQTPPPVPSPIQI